MIKTLEAQPNQQPLSEEFAATLRRAKKGRVELKEFWGEVNDRQWYLNEYFLSRILNRPEKPREH